MFVGATGHERSRPARPVVCMVRFDTLACRSFLVPLAAIAMGFVAADAWLSGAVMAHRIGFSQFQQDSFVVDLLAGKPVTFSLT